MRTSGHISRTMRDRVRSAAAVLGAFTADLRWHRVPSSVRDQVRLAVVDLLGVGVAGAVTSEHQRLIAAVAAAGPSSVLGARHGADPRDAAWLNGVVGAVLGDLDPDPLDDGLGSTWMVSRGYFKRHASCAYTHPPADAALQILNVTRPLELDDIAAVTVETHHIAAPLNRTFDGAPPNRLAMFPGRRHPGPFGVERSETKKFSIPWITAVALTEGVVGPEQLDDDRRGDATVRRLAQRVTVVRAADLDAALPDHRCARLVVELTDGRRLSAAVSDPVGDADHAPFGPAEIHDLLGADAAAVVAEIGDELDRTDDIAALLARLP
jgi:2-methylcitrate dehydratase PrpD